MAVHGVPIVSKRLQDFKSHVLKPVGRTVILPWMQGTHTRDSLSHLEVRDTS